MELNEIIGRLQNADPEEYRNIIRLCESRHSATEGIPAIIGLDDLTDTDRPVYQGAEMDKRMSEEMAIDAMLFTWLYAREPDRDPHYPPIAPAMSALAEKSFVIYDGDEGPSAYRSLYDEKD